MVSVQALLATDRFDPDPARSYTLPGHYYYAPEIYEREKEAIFYRTWNQVGHAEQVAVPGSYLTCKVADQNLIVIRGRDKVLRAFYNVCAHRAHELLQGTGHATVITCPYHGWSYHTDGWLRSARGSDRVADFDAASFRLKPVQVELFCSFLFVNLDPEARPLSEQATELEPEVRRYVSEIDRLTHAYRVTYDLAANWKTVVENYLEAYHLGPVHKTLAAALDEDGYRNILHPIHTSQHSGTNPGTEGFYDITEAEVTDHCSWWLWPNLCWLQFPGSPNLMVYANLPQGPEGTLQVVDFYLTDKTPTADEWEHIRYIEKVVRIEDKSVVESVQRGLHSRGYHQGRFIVDPSHRAAWSEHGVHHFQNLVKSTIAV